MSETVDTLGALQGLLRWYAAMGVDAPVDEVAHDRFAATPAATRTTASPPPGRAPPGERDIPAQSSSEASVREARISAETAFDLDDLGARLAALPGRGLPKTLGRMILAAGAPGARVMLIAGAPEEDDVRQGAAFVGERGVLVDAMLRAIGLDRATVYLANLIPWRFPGARAPTPLELQLCLPFARRHVALAAPEIIVCLGERAAQPLLGRDEPLTRLRGRWLDYEGDGRVVRALATFAPEYLLSQPLQKRRAWSDLQMLAAALQA